ncbi:MAG: CelD/BcsL family acetyltransferase involved in cellulose biosynthesis, partial [Enterobacterales bacterium]
FDPNSTLFNQVISACQKSNMKVASYFYAGNRYEDTSHLNFDEYLNKRSSNVKKSLKQVKRIEKKHSFRFEMMTESKDAERAISILDSVSIKSWKEEDYFKNFFSGLIHVCAAEGSMRVGVLYIDDKAVAADFAIITSGSAVGMKSVYDLEFSKYSLGSILHLYTIKYFIENDFVKSLNFGLFDDDYKKNWCTQRRELWGIAAFNMNTFRGKCGYLCYSLILMQGKLKLLLKSAISKLPRNSNRNIT